MTPEQIEAVAASDNAILLVLNCLIRHLDAKGLMQRSEFIGYLEEVAEDHKNQGTVPTAIALFEKHIVALRMDNPSDAQH